MMKRGVLREVKKGEEEPEEWINGKCVKFSREKKKKI